MDRSPWSGGELIGLCGTLMDLGAAVVVVFHAAWAGWVLVRAHDSDRARMIIGSGVMAALSFSVAGTLLKTIGVESWQQIRMLAFVLVLRTVLKRVFQWEGRTLGRRVRAAGG